MKLTICAPMSMFNGSWTSFSMQIAYLPYSSLCFTTADCYFCNGNILCLPIMVLFRVSVSIYGFCPTLVGVLNVVVYVEKMALSAFYHMLHCFELVNRECKHIF
jgi:hypothetical protein